MSEPVITPDLADLIDEVTARLERGEPVDEAALAREHPECADELRRLLPMIRALGGLSRSRDRAPFMLPGSVTGTLGDFRVIRLIGRGGMGDVYEAEQLSLGRRVALKVLPFAMTLEPRQLQRFQNEARSAASLHHPHIVPVYAVGSDRGVHYFAMQFIDGSSLAEYVRDRHRSGPDHAATSQVDRSTIVNVQSTWQELRAGDFHRNVARIGKQVAEALEHAHGVGIVHRDIKPSNLLLDSRGEIWVADFGLARSHVQNLTHSGDIVGTFRYMSPEQSQAKHDLVDHRTDIYSLGVTLYELLTGRPAISGDDQQTILRNIELGDPPSPSSIDAAIPVALETVVLKAMARETAHRYATAAELADDLQRFIDNVPVRARRLSVGQRLANWARRHRTITWSAGTSAVLIAVVAFLAITISGARVRQSLASEIVAHEQLDEALRRERQARADLQLELASSAWNDDRLEQARRLLGDFPDEHRSARWMQLHHNFHAELASWPTIAQVRHLTASPGGDRVAVVGGNNQVVVVDPKTGQALAASATEAPVRCLGFASSGEQLVIVTGRNGLVTPARGPMKPVPGDWLEVRHGTSLLSLHSWAYVPHFHATLSGDASRIACSIARQVFVWSSLAGDAITKIDVPTTADELMSVRELALDHTGERVAVMLNRQIQVWNIATRAYSTWRARSPDDEPLWCQFSPDSSKLLIRVRSRNLSAARYVLWSTADHRELGTFPSDDVSMASPAFSPDGALIAIPLQRRIDLYAIASQELLASLRGHTQAVTDMKFAPNGEQIHSVAHDQTIRTWNVRPWIDRK